VGMTGLATGPHLHYEYLVDGVHKNPQTVHLQGAEPLHALSLQEFRSATAPLLAKLVPAQSAYGPLAAERPAATPSISAFRVSAVLDDSSFPGQRSQVSIN
jgi:hypothetical protein